MDRRRGRYSNLLPVGGWEGMKLREKKRRETEIVSVSGHSVLYVLLNLGMVGGGLIGGSTPLRRREGIVV